MYIWCTCSDRQMDEKKDTQTKNTTRTHCGIILISGCQCLWGIILWVASLFHNTYKTKNYFITCFWGLLFVSRCVAQNSHRSQQNMMNPQLYTHIASYFDTNFPLCHLPLSLFPLTRRTPWAWFWLVHHLSSSLHQPIK